MLRTRFAAIAFAGVLLSASAVMAQLPRSRGPADPRYYPDLYKGPAWGMTLSEYYTFGNKADGPYGYALSGYRYGSHDDITRWKQATGTALPPGYYWQRWRERRSAGSAATSPASTSPVAPQPLAKRKAAPEPTIALEDEEQKELTAEAPAPADKQLDKSSRRNAQQRGMKLQNSTQPATLTGPDQNEVSILGSNKIRRIRSTDPASGDDKN